jgi:hypothetical protein
MSSIITTESEYHDSAEVHYAQFLSGNTNPYKDAFRTAYYIGPKPRKRRRNQSSSGS